MKPLVKPVGPASKFDILTGHGKGKDKGKGKGVRSLKEHL